ncbi:hypothetical protein SAY87_031677 [Trapa incisa]|uniref:Uncharacterized protein n=1 Tax=Trapa incisa TaxID=236973 RepID=A0AAN7KWG1_9MYRT|nr:hypothetical protein SAY87_031677 [Trapa incisa]
MATAVAEMRWPPERFSRYLAALKIVVERQVRAGYVGRPESCPGAGFSGAIFGLSQVTSIASPALLCM